MKKTLALVLAVSALTACSAQPAAEPTAPAPAPSAVDGAVQPEKITLTAGRATVEGSEADVVRFKDRIVYRFEADENRPAKVTCAEDCLVIWPPLLTDGTPVAVTGVDQALVGEVTRADGRHQVTLDGWPLYLFKNDQSPSDTGGEGVGGNWSVIRPDGKPVVKK